MHGDYERTRDLRQWEAEAKDNEFFAQVRSNAFCAIKEPHNVGGPLHLDGYRTSTVYILPFLQTGHLVTSTPESLS